MDQHTFVAHVLRRYMALPGTLGRVLRADRDLARRLYHQGVPLLTVEDAFVLALARRTAPALDPIRSLSYFLPLIDELLRTPPPPGYLDYLRRRLSRRAHA